jgi:hypothetical protein
MIMNKNNNVYSVMELVLKEAKNREMSAAYGGERGDGGARILRAQVEIFRAGLDGRIPDEWKSYEKQLDPEYKRYLELKKKFG